MLGHCQCVRVDDICYRHMSLFRYHGTVRLYSIMKQRKSLSWPHSKLDLVEVIVRQISNWHSA